MFGCLLKVSIPAKTGTVIEYIKYGLSADFTLFGKQLKHSGRLQQHSAFARVRWHPPPVPAPAVGRHRRKLDFDDALNQKATHRLQDGALVFARRVVTAFPTVVEAEEYAVGAVLRNHGGLADGQGRLFLTTGDDRLVGSRKRIVGTVLAYRREAAHLGFLRGDDVDATTSPRNCFRSCQKRVLV